MKYVARKKFDFSQYCLILTFLHDFINDNYVLL